MATEAPRDVNQNRDRPSVIFIDRAKEPGDTIERGQNALTWMCGTPERQGTTRLPRSNLSETILQLKRSGIAASDILLNSKEAPKTHPSRARPRWGTLLFGFALDGEKKQDISKTWKKDGFDLTWKFGANEEAEVA
ncbi:hypothetical protein DL765_003997 [Monosporascus sp. GIB2]|nr:hypothetical protein DL765_003997 [Monosporascus sp. GIB2]